MTNPLNIKEGQLVKMVLGDYKGRIFEFTGDAEEENGEWTYELQRTEGNAWMLYWSADFFEVQK